jgi:mitogen-activated protein kinase 15
MVGIGSEYIDDDVASMYRFDSKLGRGVYGIVWEAYPADEEDSPDPVAIKRMFNAFSNRTDAKRTYRELMYLTNLHTHPNIISLYDLHVGSNDMDMYIVMEKMDTDLGSVIQAGLQPIHIQFISWQVLNALKYIHSAFVMHRDIKPQNILVNSRCQARVGDFGMARSSLHQQIDIFGPMPTADRALLWERAAATEDAESHAPDTTDSMSLTNYCSSRWYRAPEQLVRANNYSTPVDLWAFGCVLAEMVQKKPIFPGTCTLSQLTLIVHLTGRPLDSDLKGIGSPYIVPVLEGLGKSKQGSLSELLTTGSVDVHDLVSLLLQFNPDKRLSADEALEHPFLGHFHNPDVEIIHPSFGAGGIALELNDDLQYGVSAYRDRIYADLLKHENAMERLKLERVSHRHLMMRPTEELAARAKSGFVRMRNHSLPQGN